MNIKEIATTLAILSSGSLAVAGCSKEAPATEVPGDTAAPGTPGEASCAEGHSEEGHCAGADGADAAADGGEGEASCSGEDKAEGEASCSGK